MGYPSPGVLTASIDSGIAVKSVWDVISGQVFDFALPLNSPIKSPKDLKGKTIALGSTGWQVIVDPMLVELALGFYFTATVFYALANGIYGTLPFLVLFQIGFLYTGLLSVVQQFAGDGVVLKTQVEVDQ